MTTTNLGPRCGTTGRYARDGRELCACGSIANPMGFCCEYGTPITVGIDATATRIEWVVEPVHHQCAACDECATTAITYAQVMGSVRGSSTDANHGASVRRIERVVMFR